MALKIGEAITNDPQRDDIVRAVDSGPNQVGWRLELDNGEDDHIEAVAVEGGRFVATFVDRGRRFNSAAAMGEPIGATRRSLLANHPRAGERRPPDASAPSRQRGPLSLSSARSWGCRSLFPCCRTRGPTTTTSWPLL